MLRRLTALLILLVAPTWTPAAPASQPAAQPAAVSKADVDRLFQPLIEYEYCPGVVVGVLTPAGRQVYGYGRQDGL